MKVKVNEKCIGCGSCVSITNSQVFDFNDDGFATCIVDEVNDEQKEMVEQAITYCPVEAIVKEEN